MNALTVSVSQAAELLGVSDDLIYRLIADGVLPAIKLGGRKVVPVRAIDLVVDRALAGFDPDAVLAGLAGAAHSSDGEHGMPSVGEWTGTTGPETRHPASRQAPAEPGTSRLRPLRSPPG